MASIQKLAAGSSAEQVECRDELVTDILSRVSTRDLMRMSRVSKRWKTLILDPYFVHTHCKNCHRESIFCLVDIRHIEEHHCLPKQCQFSSYNLQTGNLSNVPFSWEGLDSYVHNRNFELLTASNGLMCFYPRFSIIALLWVYNPVTKSSKPLTLPFRVNRPPFFAEICYMQNTLKFVMAGFCVSQQRLCTLVFDFHSNSWSEGSPLPTDLFFCEPTGAQLFFNGVFYFVASVLCVDTFDFLHMIIGYDVNQDQWGSSLFMPSTVGFIYCLTEWEGNLLACASRGSRDEGVGHFVFWILDTENKLWIRERELDLSHQLHTRWSVSASGGVVWFTSGYNSVTVYHMKTRCCSSYLLNNAFSPQKATDASFVSFEPTLLAF